ncbi:hypothetical protein V7S43_004889 [Phytophthora oleae]|uniref:Uncharacterized protein n=1 Tax=Phytophthora oleae TaxID=2107226 RepID=A0ABD3FUH2_9STRA
MSTLEVRVALGGGNSPVTSEPVEQANVMVVTRHELLAHFDVARSVKQGQAACAGRLEDFSGRAMFKKQVAARNIQLLVVNANELACRVEDDDVATVGLQAAFLRHRACTTRTWCWLFFLLEAQL